MRRPVKISRQIFHVMLLNIGIASLLVALLSILGVREIRRIVGTESRRMTVKITGENREVLVARARRGLKTAAQNKARLLTDKLANMEEQTRVFAEFLTRIYSAPENYPPRVWETYSISSPKSADYNIDIYEKFAPEINPEDFRDEIALAANAFDFMRQVIFDRRAIVCGGAITLANGSFLAIEERLLSDTENAPFDFRTRTWYRGAAQSGKRFWSDVYPLGRHDQAVSCAQPFYDLRDGGKILKGVAVFDLVINRQFQQLLDEEKITPSSYAFLVDQNGKPIGTSQGEGKLRDALTWGISDLLWGWRQANEHDWLIETSIGGEPALIAFSKLEILPWMLGIVTPISELDEVSKVLDHQIEALTSEMQAEIQDQFTQFFRLQIGAILLIGLFTSLLGNYLARRITSQIAELTRRVQEISRDTGSTPPEIVSGDKEIVALHRAITTVSGKVRKMQAAHESRAAEDAALEKIYDALLPEDAKKFGDDFNLNLDATVRRDEKSSVSIYDFFKVENGQDGKIGLLAARVGGGRAAGALLFTALKTQLRGYVARGLSPADAFAEVNREIYFNHGAKMFVTAVFGLLDCNSGALAMVGAGAPSPICRRDGKFFPVPMRSAIALGITKNAEYRSTELIVAREELWFFHTLGDDRQSRLSRFADAFNGAKIANISAGLAKLVAEAETENLAAIGFCRR